MNLRRRHRVTSEVSTHSLNDIMFFLLLFFLITSTMINPNMLKLMLPKADNKVASTKSITVSIDAALQYYINKNKTDESSLPSSLEGILKGNEEPVIVIQAERTVPIENVVKVMAIGKKLNAKVLLATQPE